MFGVTTATHVAEKRRVVVGLASIAGQCVGVQIAEAAGVEAGFEAADFAAITQPEVDRAAARVVAVPGRRRATDDVDIAVCVCVGKIGPRQAVGLRDIKTILGYLDVAHAIRDRKRTRLNSSY